MRHLNRTGETIYLSQEYFLAVENGVKISSLKGHYTTGLIGGLVSKDALEADELISFDTTEGTFLRKFQKIKKIQKSVRLKIFKKFFKRNTIKYASIFKVKMAEQCR